MKGIFIGCCLKKQGQSETLTLLSVVLCATCFAGTVKKKEHPVYGAFFKEVDPSVTATKLSFDSDSD